MRNPTFDGLLDDMKTLHSKKNADYASDDDPYSTFRLAAEVAGVTVEQALLVFIGTKAARLVQLEKGKTPNFESQDDTCIDLAVYAALLAAYRRDKRRPKDIDRWLANYYASTGEPR